MIAVSSYRIPVNRTIYWGAGARSCNPIGHVNYFDSDGIRSEIFVIHRCWPTSLVLKCSPKILSFNNFVPPTHPIYASMISPHPKSIAFSIHNGQRTIVFLLRSHHFKLWHKFIKKVTEKYQRFNYINIYI